MTRIVRVVTPSIVGLALLASVSALGTPSASGESVDILSAPGWLELPIPATARPELSRDGRHLAWIYRRSDGVRAAAIYDVAEGRRVEAPLGNDGRAYVEGWSPHSSKAWVLHREGQKLRVFTANAQNGALSQECELPVAEKPGGSAVSPVGDALSVVFQRSDGQSAIALVDGSLHKHTVKELEGKYIAWAGLQWSPDGELIVLPVSTKDQYRWRLMVLRARDWEKRLLPPGVGPTFAWSPDSVHVFSWQGARRGLHLVSVSVASGEVTRRWSLPEIKFFSQIAVEPTSGLLAVPLYGDKGGRVWVCSPNGGVHELPPLGSATGNVAWTSVKDWLLVARESPTARPRDPENRWLGPREERLSLINCRSGETVELPGDVSYWSVSADGTTLVVRARLVGKEEESVFVCNLRKLVSGAERGARSGSAKGSNETRADQVEVLYRQWRSAVEKDLEMGRSWVFGDQQLSKQLGGMVRTRPEFFLQKLHENMFVVLILEQSPLYERHLERLRGLRGMQESQDVWREILEGLVETGADGVQRRHHHHDIPLQPNRPVDQGAPEAR